MWQATVRSVDIVSDLAAAESIDAKIMRGGMAALGIGPDAQARFEQSVSWYREHVGVDWEVLGPGRVGEVIGHGPFTTAIFEPEGFGIQPARFVFGLASRAAAAGARLVSHCEATSFEKDGPGFLVLTIERPGPGRRDRPRHQRLHHRSTLGRARPTHRPRRVLHRRHRADRRSGNRDLSGRGDDLYQETAAQLHAAHPGRSHPDRGKAKPPHGARSGRIRRRPPGPAHRIFPPARRRASDTCLGRQARRPLRPRAPHGPGRRRLVCPGLRRSRSRVCPR